MGAANCCKKPDEIIIEEIKYSNTDNKKNKGAERDSYPQDTEQDKGNNNGEEENAQGQIIHNSNLNEQNGDSPKIGGVYEVPIISSNSQKNIEEGYQLHNMGAYYQYENKNMHSQNVEEANINQYKQEEKVGYQYSNNVDKAIPVIPKTGEEKFYNKNLEEEGLDYNALVNQMGNEANMKALRMENEGLNSISSSYYIKQPQQTNINNYNIQNSNIEKAGGVNLNAFTQQSQDGVELNSLTIGTQQQAKTTSQIIRPNEVNNLRQGGETTTTTTTTKRQVNMKNFEAGQEGMNTQVTKDIFNQYFQQATSKFGSVNSDLEGNDNFNKFFQQASSQFGSDIMQQKVPDIRQLAYSENPQIKGGLDINELYQKENIETHINQKNSNIASVTPISANEDISKYFKKANIISNTQSNVPIGLTQVQKISQSQVLNSEENNLNKYFQKAISGKIGPDELKDLNNNQMLEASALTDINEPKQINSSNIKMNMNNLPESFNINNYKKIAVATKISGNNIQKETANTTSKGKIELIDLGDIDLNNLPETFGSNEINNFQQVTTTTDITQQKPKIELKVLENVDLNNLPESFGTNEINHFKQETITTTVAQQEPKIELKGLENVDLNNIPEAFGSNEINNFKQTTITKTIKTTGDINPPDLTKNINSANKIEVEEKIPTITQKEVENIDIQELPKPIAPIGNNNFKQVITTTKTEGNIDMNNLPEVFGTNEEGKIELKALENIDFKDLPETFGSNDINNFKQTTTTTITKGKIDMDNLPEGFDLSKLNNVEQTTTTKTTEGKIEPNNFKEILEDGKIELEGLENKNVDIKDDKFGTKEIGNFKQITTTNTTKTSNAGNLPIDLENFSLENNSSATPEALASIGYNNMKQTTNQITKTTENPPIDLKQFGIEQNPSTSPITQNVDYNKFFQTEKTTSEPIDLKQFELDNNPSAMSNIQQITKTTKTTTTNAGNVDLKEFQIEQNPSSSPITGNENYNKYFQTKETTITKADGPVDLSQFGIEQNPSQIPVEGNQDYIKYFQTKETTSTKTNGPIDLNQFGIEQNASQIPQKENKDYKFFETKEATSTKVNEPIDLNQFGIDSSNGGLDLKSFGVDNIQQKTTTAITNEGNIDNIASSEGFDLNAFGLGDGQQKIITTTTTTKEIGNDNFGIPNTSDAEPNNNDSNPNASSSKKMSYNTVQNSANTYDINKITTTKISKSFVGPTQSYSYKYSYNMPPTDSTTNVAKTTYSRVGPDNNYQ